MLSRIDLPLLSFLNDVVAVCFHYSLFYERIQEENACLFDEGFAFSNFKCHRLGYGNRRADAMVGTKPVSLFLGTEAPTPWLVRSRFLCFGNRSADAMVGKKPV